MVVLGLKGRHEKYQKNIASKFQFRKTEGILDVKYHMYIVPIWEKHIVVSWIQSKEECNTIL